METITVRGLESELIKKMRQFAKQEGKSMDRFVLDIIKEHMVIKEEKTRTKIYHDMDHLFGKWSNEEFRQVQDKIDAQRKIDPELWK